MQYQWFVALTGLLDLLIFSLSLFLISNKLEWKKNWKAWIPGLRMYCLSESVGMHNDSIPCGISDILYMLASFTIIPSTEDSVDMVIALIQLVVFLFMFIYRIRVFIEVLKLFEQSKKWLFVWIIFNWLPYLIFAIGKKYQPNRENIKEESWQAGSKPMHTTSDLCDAVPLVDEGLSIRIHERTVRETGKKRYLLKDIAMNIPKNTMVMLLGGSGAGKTTMINALIGYEKADATILLNGADVYKRYDSLQHNIGFVPQQNLIRGKDSVAKTVDDAAKIRLPKSVSREKRQQRIEEVMELLGLSSSQKGLVSKKSGGQLRRICIAMELVTDPDLFVLDEPDSGLDGAIAREIFTKLRQIADEGRVVIVITHTPDRVVEFFDKVIVLAKDSSRVGRLAFYGSPREAKEFFGKESMEEIVMCVNRKDEGGEGRADEMIEKYTSSVIAAKGGEAI